MNRRSFLSVLAASISGCSTTASPRTLATETTQAYPTVSIQPDSNALLSGRKLDARLQKRFSRDYPARIRISYQNTSLKARTIWFGDTPPFSDYWGDQIDGDEMLLLIPDYRETVYIEGGMSSLSRASTEGCWQLRSAVWAGQSQRKRYLRPFETITEEYTLVGHPDNEACLPRGKFRFEQTFEEASWGFTVELSD